MFNLKNLPKVLEIKLPLNLDNLQIYADKILDMSMGMSLEEIVHDSVLIGLGQYTVDEWLETSEQNIWREHVSNDYLDEVMSYCRSLMGVLLNLYKGCNLPILPRELVDELDIDFKEDSMEVRLTFTVF